MKKISRLVIIAILVISMLYLGSVEAQDSGEIQLHSVGFDRNNATVGDVVSINIDATAGSNLIEDIYLELSYWDNSTGYYDYLEGFWFEVAIDGFSIDWQIGQYDPDTHVIVQYVEIMDSAGNWDYFYLNDTFSPILDIYGTTPDLEGPTLNWISMSPGNVTSGDIVTVEANVTDDLSGVEYVYFEFHYRNETDGYTRYVKGGDLFLQTNGLWQTTFEVNQYWYSGNYSIQYVGLQDNEGNHRWYENNTYAMYNFSSPVISIYGTTGDLTPPELHDFWFGTDVVAPGSEFQVYANASDNLAGVNSVSMEFSYMQDNQYYWGTWVSLEFDSSSGLFIGTAYVDQEIPQGVYLYASYIDVQDNAGNWRSYYNGSDYTSPEILVAPNEEITVSVSPSNGRSIVGETVTFDTTITSTFRHDMNNISMEFRVKNQDTQEITTETRSFDLPQGSTSVMQFDVTFDTIGSYNIRATVIDDIGEPWIFEIGWSVVEDGPTDTDTNSEPTNDSTGPDFNLPGFEMPLTILSFVFISITTYQIRKRR